MQNFTMPITTREQPYSMPTSMMVGLQNNASTFADNAIPLTLHNTNIPSVSSIPGRNPLPFLTTNFVNSLRQQKDESNHEMINLLTQQIDTMFNPLIQTTNQSY